MIKVEKINKTFEKTKALTDLSMNIKKGSIYGLIGKNGSGKTTIIKHITGVLRPDSGTITVEGEPVYENISLKERFGFIPDDLFFFSTYTLREMSRFLKALYPKWSHVRFNRMVEDFGLNENSKLSKLSKGTQKQAAFVLTMSTIPDYLILDEPIDGLDPIVRKKVWNCIMDDVAERKMTVLISSHNLKEMEGVCDAIGIILDGTIAIEKDLDDLKTDIHKIQVAFKEPVTAPYEGLEILHRQRQGSVDLLVVRDKKELVEDTIKKHHPAIFDMLPLTLEEIFIYELGGMDNDLNKAVF